MIYKSILECTWLPKLIYPDRNYPNLIAVVFEFMKRIPAQFCIDSFLSPVQQLGLGEDGWFEDIESVDADTCLSFAFERDDQKCLFIETSSGNMASGLAEICQVQRLPLFLLVPPGVDEDTKA